MRDRVRHAALIQRLSAPLVALELGSSCFLASGCNTARPPSRTEAAIQPSAPPPAANPTSPVPGSSPPKASSSSSPAIFKLRALSDQTVNALDEAVIPASKRVLPGNAKPTTGNGCQKLQGIQAQGYYEEKPVRAAIELLGKQITVKLTGLDGARVVYSGTLDQSLCDHQGEGDLLGLSGSLSAKGAAPPRLNVSLDRNDAFTVDRFRIRVSGVDADSNAISLDLWDVPPERLDLRDTYQKALGDSVDVEAVLKTPTGTFVLAVLALGERQLSLVELGGRPLKVLHSTETGLECEYQGCNAGITGAEVSPGVVALTATVFGEDCGGKCTSKAAGELWTLVADGFHLAHDLPGSYEMPGTLSGGGTSERVTLSWVDGDGSLPLELLVEAAAESAENDAPSRFIAGYDPVTRSYTRWEALPLIPGEELASFRGGEFTSY